MLKQSLPFLFPRLLTVNCYNRIAAGVYGYPAAACFDVPVFALSDYIAVRFLYLLPAPVNNIIRI